MNINRTILLLFLLFLSNTIGFSQKQKDAPKSIIQYHDGSVFIGHIVEENVLTLKLIAATLDTLNINKAFIKRIRRNDKDIIIHRGGKFHFTKGLFYSLQLGGGGNEDESSQIDFIIGNRFNKKVSLGLGTGFHYNSTFFAGNWIETNTTPIYAYGRYYPFDNKVRPFVFGKAGWGIPNENAFGDEHNGGVMLQSGIGVHFASRKNTRLIISLSQYLQNAKGESINFDLFGNQITSKFSLWFSRVIFKVGIEWK